MSGENVRREAEDVNREINEETIYYVYDDHRLTFHVLRQRLS